MATLKRTYALPRETIEEFERATPGGERSALIAQLISKWLEDKKREQLRQEVIEGCRAMADVYLEMEREYHPMEEEVHHALEGDHTHDAARLESMCSRRTCRW